MITAEHQQFYDENGYVVVKGLFSTEEIEHYRNHFMTLRKHGPRPGDFAGVDPKSTDPLKAFPRMIHMHHWDELSLDWVLDTRLNACMTDLLGNEPFAAQTMLYFKPPGSRGQALHQDNFYLRVQPGTCMAAWMALDDCDEANGCMQIVPGSHQWPTLCIEKADTSVSFTDVTVPLPDGVKAEPVLMEAGDVLFFNGAVVHGSYPNTSKDRFRRALIGHYVEGVAEQVAAFYQPLLRMDGSQFEMRVSADGSACGVWVDRDGEPVVEMVGAESVVRKHE